MRTFGRIFGSGKLGWYRLSALLVSVVAVTKAGLDIIPNWQTIGGVEAHWIAQCLATGKGYGFPSGYRWLFESVEFSPFLKIDGGVCHSSAWADPVYTFCLAGLIWLFGDYHQLAAAVFNLILLLLVLGLTYRLCERLISAPAGVMAVVILLLELKGPIFLVALSWMNNAMLATTLVVLSALMLVKFLDEPSYERVGVLGLVLGLTSLGCPSAQLFIPVAAAAVAVWGRKNLRNAFSQAILMLVMAAIIVMPWTVRNFIVFHKFVPVRTGFGQIAFTGVVAAGGMVAPEKLHTHVTPLLSAGGTREAVRNLCPPYELEAVERWQLDYAKEVGGAAYAAMNEAQRDSWFLQETKAFLVANPVLSARLAIAKLEQFARVFGTNWKLACLLALLGGLFAIRKPAVLILALWVGSYIGPFLLTICYYPQYRTPIEPLLVVLAVFAVWQVFEMGANNQITIKIIGKWRKE